MIVTPTMVREAAYEFLMLHELVGWRFAFNDHKRCLGMCRYREKRIEVSMELVRAQVWDQILETIKHEIAHALVGPGHGHDATWKAKAIEVGAKPVACAELNAVPPSGVGAKYVAECPCGQRHYLYRRAKLERYCVKAGKDAGVLVFKPKR